LPAGWSGTPQIVHVGLDNTGIRLLTNTLSNPVTGQRFDLTTGLKSSVGGMNAGSMKIGSFYGIANVVLIEAIVVDRIPSSDRHFVCPSGGGALVVRTTRCADNFVGGLSSSSDATRFLSYLRHISIGTTQIPAPIRPLTLSKEYRTSYRSIVMSSPMTIVTTCSSLIFPASCAVLNKDTQ
jgi:hypothetical protein